MSGAKRSPAMQRALDALDGLSVGDAFGEQFFRHEQEVIHMLDARQEPPGEWRWTDDTAMALSVVAVLHRHARMEQKTLAAAFGAAYRHDPRRVYGLGMHRLLPRYDTGDEWHRLAPEQFHGQGSFGNGAAMRVAPLGAFFAGDLDAVVREAAASAEVTHAHPEGVAGAIAIAVAAAIGAEGTALEAGELIERVHELTPEGEVRRRLGQAMRLSGATDARDVAAAVGSGAQVSAQDTVPFCVWIATYHGADYREALWQTVSGLGDRDTTCAIVGGIVAARLGREAIPAAWLANREGLPPWVNAPRGHRGRGRGHQGAPHHRVSRNITREAVRAVDWRTLTTDPSSGTRVGAWRSGSAPALGAGGPQFESGRPDLNFPGEGAAGVGTGVATGPNSIHSLRRPAGSAIVGLLGGWCRTGHHDEPRLGDRCC
jgi:ADP-ribosylglycohydrolase